jgi:hypothetical protein
MLETGFHQGAGLQGLAAHTAPRLVAMASHGDRASELPLLWDLCAAWTELGYPVVVLDATHSETPQQPGLQQLLDPQCRTEELPREAADMAWPIHPAGLGLRQLFTGSDQTGYAQAMGQLEQLFQNYDVVLLYAPAALLAERLPDSGIAPLLTVSATGSSVLTAYQALKSLLINGRLQPTIVSMVDASDHSSKACGENLNKSLQDCARSFLGRQVHTLCVDMHPASDPALRDVNRLALRLLESGTTQPWESARAGWHGALPGHDSAMRSH